MRKVNQPNAAGFIEVQTASLAPVENKAVAPVEEQVEVVVAEKTEEVAVVEEAPVKEEKKKKAKADTSIDTEVVADAPSESTPADKE